MTLHEFIRKRKYLIWWVKDYDKLKAESIVEATLNYGDWDDVQLLIRILGIKKVAKIFRAKSKPSKMGRQNYRSEVKHYFNLYFNLKEIHRRSRSSAVTYCGRSQFSVRYRQLLFSTFAYASRYFGKV